jgi:nucleotide-binding universal stress UspA family protein
MGTTGQSGFLRKWFGSVSTKVMNESPSPVLLIPEGANYHGVNKIAYEDIEQDKSVIEDVASLADQFVSKIHLIHVENVGTPDPGYYLTELLKQEYPLVMISTTTIESDDIAKGISDYCIAHNIDLICLSTHKKRFFEQLFDDNISQQMSIISRLPLLI